MSICEQCGKEHDGTFGSGRFCSRSCSNKWVALHQSPEAKARKVEKGKENLNLSPTRGWKLTKEQLHEATSKGGKATAAKRRAVRKLWVEKIISGEDTESEVYSAGYSRFRNYLIEFGYKDRRCECCGNTEWLGEPIPVELHHKDGNGSNNRLENLQILCPNCHAMTDNHGWKYYNNHVRNKE